MTDDAVEHRWYRGIDLPRVALAALIVLALEGSTLLDVRAGVLLALHVGALGVVLVASRRTLTGPTGRWFGLAAALALGLVFADALLSQTDRYQALWEPPLPTLPGLTAALILLGISSGERAPAESWTPPRRA